MEEKSRIPSQDEELQLFPIETLRSQLQSSPRSPLGPTLSGRPPTIELLELITSKEAAGKEQIYIGLADDAPVYYVILRGPFFPSGISVPPGVRIPPSVERVVEIYDAKTGNLLVHGVGR